MAQPMLGKTPDRPPDMQLIQSGPAGKTARVSRKSVIGLAVLLSFSFVLNAVVAFEASSTTDEPHHLLYARRLLHVEADRVIPDYCDSQMPISVLNELPEASGSFLDGHRLLPSIASVLQHQRPAASRRCHEARDVGVDTAPQTGTHRHEAGVRPSRMRLLHRSDRRRAALFVLGADIHSP